MNDNALARIVLDVEYVCGPLATTDLHAGGNFFCVLFEAVLIFRSGNVVEEELRVLDNWRPLDDEPASLMTKGTWGLDGKGNVTCAFPDACFTGLPYESNPDWLAFHVYHKQSTQGEGRVYRR